jgi:hypothetical protein
MMENATRWRLKQITGLVKNPMLLIFVIVIGFMIIFSAIAAH